MMEEITTQGIFADSGGGGCSYCAILDDFIHISTMMFRSLMFVSFFDKTHLILHLLSMHRDP